MAVELVPLIPSRNLADVSSATTARTNLGLAIGSDVQAYDATLAALAGVATAADKFAYFTGSDTAAVADATSYGRSLLAMTADTDLMADLSLDDMAFQAADNVDVTGGSIAGVTLSSLAAALPVADGGTGATSASGARTNLGVEKACLRISLNTTSLGSSNSGAETDLQSYTIPNNTLATSGASLQFRIELTFAANSNNKTVKAYLGLTQIYTSTTVAQNGGGMFLRGYIYYGTATNAECYVAADIPQGGLIPAGGIRTNVTLSGSGFGSTVVFKTTGQGTATNDVVARITDVLLERNSA